MRTYIIMSERRRYNTLAELNALQLNAVYWQHFTVGNFSDSSFLRAETKNGVTNKGVGGGASRASVLPTLYAPYSNQFVQELRP